MSKEKVDSMIKRITDGMRKTGQKPNLEAIKKKCIETAKRVDGRNKRT